MDGTKTDVLLERMISVASRKMLLLGVDKVERYGSNFYLISMKMNVHF